jgi:hypothetical protein
MTHAEVYKVMIASPGDVTEERKIIREVISEWNAVNSEARKIVLLPIGWETHTTPEMGDRAQAIINEQLKNCDLLVGVFWTRIGTATGEYQSGSVEEIKRHIDARKPVMLYFSSAPVAPEIIDPSQYAELQKFKRICEQNGLCGSYSDPIEFRSTFARQLHLKLNSEPFIEEIQPDSQVEEQYAESATSLSREAQMILKELSKSSNGRILLPGWGIQIGQKQVFYRSLSPRDRAAFDDAIDVLEALGFIKAEGYKREIFNITTAGFQAGDNL